MQGRFLRRFLATFVPLALAIIGAAAVMLDGGHRQMVRDLRTEERRLVDMAVERLALSLAEVVRDVRFLAQAQSVADFAAAGSPATAARLAADFSAFMRGKGLYDQLRFLDPLGHERVRVNFGSGHPVIVPNAALQDKSTRYYVDAVLHLGPTDMFVSPLDLNIENGQIEVPHKPMLRVGMQIRNAEGRTAGLLLANVLAQRLLDTFAATAAGPNDHLFLLNGQGYWLHSPKAADAWGFMFGRTETFATRRPAIWEQVHAHKIGQLLNTEGLWTFKTITPHATADPATDPAADEVWIALSMVDPKALRKAAANRTLGIDIGAGILLLTAVWASWSLAAMDARREATERRAFDEQGKLIDLLNRTGRIARVGGWEYDVAADQLSWSDQVYHIHGVAPGTPIDVDRALAFHPPDAKRKLRAALAHCIETGQGWDLELPFTTATGEAFWGRSIGQAEWRDGRCLRLFGISADITDRKRLELSLAASEARFRDIAEVSSDWIWEIDFEARYTFVSDKVRDVLGYTAAELIGRSPFEHVEETDRTRHAKTHGQALAQGRPFRDLENWYRRKDGQSICALTSGNPVFGADGALIGYRGTGRDITDRKRVERALVDNLTALRLAQEMGHIGNWTFDPAVGIPVWSDIVYDIYERDPAQRPPHLDDHRWLYAPDQYTIFADAIRAAIDSGRRFSTTLRLDLPTGTTKWVAISCQPDSVRGPCGHFLRGTIQDITDRVSDLDRLQTLDDRVKLAAAAAGVGIYEWDVPSDRLFWNEQMHTIYGIPTEQVPASAAAWAERVEPEDFPAVEAAVRQAIATLGIFTTEFRIRRPDGSVRSIAASGQVRQRTDGRGIRLIGTNWDVTDYRQALSEVEAARREAESVNRAKSRFMALISHELRTPLNAINGFADFLAITEADDRRREQLRMIGSSGETLLRIINRILLVASIESGDVTAKQEAFSLAGALDRALLRFKPQADLKGLRLATAVAADVPDLLCGASDLLGQVLDGLVENAVKFTEAGSVTVSVDRTKDGDGDLPLLFRVSDTGIGVTPEKHASIFELFEQGDDPLVRRVGGAGLGLTIVTRIIALLRGRLWLTSDLGTGSCFCFTAQFSRPPPGTAA